MKSVQARWVEPSIHALPFLSHDGHVVYRLPTETRYLAADMLEYHTPGAEFPIKIHKFEPIWVQEIIKPSV